MQKTEHTFSLVTMFFYSFSFMLILNTVLGLFFISGIDNINNPVILFMGISFVTACIFTSFIYIKRNK